MSKPLELGEHTTSPKLIESLADLPIFFRTEAFVDADLNHGDIQDVPKHHLKRHKDTFTTRL